MKSKATALRTPSTAVPENVRQVVASPGHPLEAPVATYFTGRFGFDFSRVRVHADAEAAQSASDVGASAYAIGAHIAFGAGRYAPGSPAGMRLIAHELAHVAQQRGATPAGPIAIGAAGDVHEREADDAARNVLAGRSATVSGTPAPRLQRVPAPPVQVHAVPAAVPAQESHFVANFTRTPVMLMRQPVAPEAPDPTIPLDFRGEPSPEIRETNEGCMDKLCASIQHQVPQSEAQAMNVIESMRQKMPSCIQKTAASSKARFRNEIARREIYEVDHDYADLRLRAKEIGFPLSSTDNFIADACRAKQAKLKAELRHNVILIRFNVEHPAWNQTLVDQADRELSLLPAEVTWNSPVLTDFPLDFLEEGVGGRADYERGRKEAHLELSKTAGMALNPLSGRLTIPHEVGHVVEYRVPRKEIESLKAMIQWEEFSFSDIGRGGTHRQTAKDTIGADDFLLDSWMNKTIRVDAAIDLNGRRWLSEQSDHIRGQNPNVIVGARPDVLPMIEQMVYARTGFREWFAEVYMFAVSQPEFVHQNLPADVVDWFKYHVFGTPAAKWYERLQGLGVTPTPKLVYALSRIFTWKQAYKILDAEVPGWRRAAKNRSAQSPTTTQERNRP